MKKALMIISAILMTIFIVSAALPSNYVSAGIFEVCSGSDGNCGSAAGKVEDKVDGALGLVYLIVGALAVGYLIYGGVKYAISAGDPGKIASAKNTITYAIIGLIVAASAYAITSFVITSL